MNVLRIAADVLSLPYRMGFEIWKFIALRRKRPHIPAYTITVGNLTLGGSGKSPFVIELGRELMERGIKFAVLSRGYRRRSKGLQAVPPNSAVDPIIVGDEPALIFRKLGGKVPVIADRDRLRGGRYAVEQFDVEAVILDDGFQYLRILHDYLILLVNVEDLNGGPLLPFGRFREPLSAMKRADLIVINYRDREFDDREFNFGITPYIRMRYEIKVPVPPGTHAFVFAGIARPSEFLNMLRKNGVEVVGHKFFMDHKWYSDKDISKILKRARDKGADVVLTTEKDFIRLKSAPDMIKPVELETHIERIDHIASILASKIVSFRRIS